jgi:hypothetical protein
MPIPSISHCPTPKAQKTTPPRHPPAASSSFLRFRFAKNALSSPPCPRPTGPANPEIPHRNSALYAVIIVEYFPSPPLYIYRREISPISAQFLPSLLPPIFTHLLAPRITNIRAHNPRSAHLIKPAQPHNPLSLDFSPKLRHDSNLC